MRKDQNERKRPSRHLGTSISDLARSSFGTSIAHSKKVDQAMSVQYVDMASALRIAL